MCRPNFPAKKEKPPSPVKGWKPELSLYHLYILTYASLLTVRFRHCLLWPFGSATQEWYSDILYWQRIPTISVSLKRSKILTVSINVFITDNHILGGINCQQIFILYLLYLSLYWFLYYLYQMWDDSHIIARMPGHSWIDKMSPVTFIHYLYNEISQFHKTLLILKFSFNLQKIMLQYSLIRK